MTEPVLSVRGLQVEFATRRQVLAIPDSTPLWGGGGGGGRYSGPGYSGDGGGLFSRLFGSFNTAPTPPAPAHHHAPAQRKESSTTTTVQR